MQLSEVPATSKTDCFATDLRSFGGEELRQMCKRVYLQDFALKLMNELN